MERIITAIQNESWEEALNLFVDYTQDNKLDDNLCILGASILEHFGDREGLFGMIQNGLKINGSNYELYLLLGNYYSAENADKAFLSYENALYYARRSGNNEDVSIIESIIENYKNEVEINVRNVSILILENKDEQYEKQCIECVKDTCFEDAYDIQKIAINHQEQFVADLNLAVQNSNRDNDIFIVTSNVILTPNALFYLRMALYDNEQIGVVSASSNMGLSSQMSPFSRRISTVEDGIEYAKQVNIPGRNNLEDKAIVGCNYLIIRRELVGDVFPLDEGVVSDRFVSIDLSLSVRKTGHLNVICWNGFVFSYPSETRTKILYDKMGSDKVILKNKWGISAEYYMNTRKELVDMIKRDPEEEIAVLEVGAGLGSTLTYVKYKFPNSKVCGIEIVENVVGLAAPKANVKCDNIETYQFENDEKYDYIIFGDVLEHLVDPYSLVDNLKKHLRPGGCIIASIPNILNAGAIYELLHGGFEYKSAGILDSTHLRFFTKREVINLFHRRGYEIVDMFGTLGTENSHTFGDFFDKLTSIEGVVEREQFDFLQYVVCAKVKG